MLDLSKLQNVNQRGGKTIAACPVCRVAGGDRKGNHLFINSLDGSGEYGCVAHPRDGEHNRQIFALVGIAEDKELSPVEKRQWSKEKRQRELRQHREQLRITKQENLTKRIEEVMERKLAPYLSSDWQADLWHDSPIRFDHPEAAPHDFIRSLFKPDDILWLGEVCDSGAPYHAANFKTCREWLTVARLPPRIAAGTFKTGSISRCAGNVDTAPFIIIESDDIIGHKPTTPEEKEANRSLSHALNGYAQDKLGLKLRAVISTGGKSLHSWYDRPRPDGLRAIERMIAGLRIDADAFKGCQAFPLRMPGCQYKDTETRARLLYLNPVLP